MIYNLLDRPVVTLTEATMILGLSASTIKRRLQSGQLRQVKEVIPGRTFLSIQIQ